MHPEDIRAEIRKRFGSMAELSRHLNLSPSAIAQAVGRPGYSRRIEDCIAKAIGIPAPVIWPKRYKTDGTPIPYRDARCPTQSDLPGNLKQIALRNRKRRIA